MFTAVRNCVELLEVPWQEAALCEALAHRVRPGQLQLVPLLLPGSRRPERESELPFFLRRLTWLTYPEQENQLAELTGSLATTQGVATAETLTQTCPFRGLEVFREQDARFFFGREAIIQQLDEHLQHGTPP